MVSKLCIVFLVFLAGCSAIPSMKYCDDVTYIRKGTDIRIEANCHALIGGL